MSGVLRTMFGVAPVSAGAGMLALKRLSASGASADASGSLYRAGNHDYSWLTRETYQSGLAGLATDILSAKTEVRLAEAALGAARVERDSAIRAVSAAWNGYLAARSSGRGFEALREAWRTVGSALREYRNARDHERLEAGKLEEANRELVRRRFRKAGLENDWREAQSARDAASLITVLRPRPPLGNRHQPSAHFPSTHNDKIPQSDQAAGTLPGPSLVSPAA